MNKIILALALTVSTIGIASATTITRIGEFTYINSGSTNITCSNIGNTTYCN